MSAPKEILELVERFERNREAYRSGQYNETQLRREFLDPLFEVLGWDVNNKQGYAEAYKDVIHEDAIKIGGFTKAPDYCFRIGGARKFFVEAKKPSVSVKEEISPAFQLRRYAWSAKLPLSILTDFEELAVYDCRVKPVASDKATAARVLYLTCREYSERYKEIASIFSREAVLKGSFDRYAESTRLKKGTAEVDDAFLQDIESWREMLARNIALRNPGLTQRELNFAVQCTIDRIIFLRICEDRGVEEYGQLQALQNGGRVYARLCELFQRADARYNSGLFHFEKEKTRPEPPDELTLNLSIDDHELKEITKSLYYPESPYEFSVFPADILGQVYEQFLGKVIRLTAGHRAVVEDKPEAKKAGGVFYTPTYIVEYIVKNTVGKLVEGKTPKQVAGAHTGTPLRILDPACGSGSFLIGAYQYLLDWHRDWYVTHDPKKWAAGRSPALYQTHSPSPLWGEGKGEAGNKLHPYSPSPLGGEGRGEGITPSLLRGEGKGEGQAANWRLTTGERKRILLNNIYGVDIDPQAVEVTKLSLLLKVLEGENTQTLATQLRLFNERALPDLSSNIKCGNSLIGPDFYDNAQMGLLDEEERYRINVFDWHAEFPQVFASSPDRGKESKSKRGFDAVIGNPPYIRIQTMKEWAPLEVEFYKQRYASASKGNYDIYIVFVEKCLNLLCGQGWLGLILPHKFFNAQYGEALRGIISGGKHLAHIVHFGDQQVFAGATTYTCLLFLDKSGNEYCRFVKVSDLAAWRTTAEATEGNVPCANVTSAEWNFTVGPGVALFEKLSKMPAKLGDVADRMAQGIRTSANEVYVLDLVSADGDLITAHSKQLKREVQLERKAVSLFLQGREIKPYRILPSGKVVIIPYRIENGRANLIPEKEMREQFQKTFAYLLENKPYLENRERGRMRGSSWYAYVYPKNIDVMGTSKILVPDIADSASFALDETGEYAFTSGYGITLKHNVAESSKYVLGLLNSQILDFYLKSISTTMRGGFFRYFTQFIEQLPIRTMNFTDPADKARHDRMVALVEQMLALHKQLAVAKTEHERDALQRQTNATDRQIDALVYELYGLTEEEIRTVEGE
ncbi:MAG: Eco57I restriction-modification methylase domain-containing protein [Candidatus Eisenbacteria bacterium]|nr:Eco57I restriction-modification methylase domain-containing protein [Candidatus Eisenbacteria bacterium]